MAEPGGRSTVSVQLDGMDQARFALPGGRSTVSVPGSAGCTCRRVCPDKFSSKLLDEMRAEHHALQAPEKTKRAFDAVRSQVSDKDGHVIVQGRTSWTLRGQVVCRPFWEYAHGLGHGVVDKALKVLRAGGAEPMEAMPRLPCASSGHAWRQADAWFLRVHQDLGEPLAIADPAMHHLEAHELLESPDHPLWAISILCGDKRYAPKRYLNPGTFEDLFLMHCAMVPAQDQVSKLDLPRRWPGQAVQNLRAA